MGGAGWGLACSCWARSAFHGTIATAGGLHCAALAPQLRNSAKCPATSSTNARSSYSAAGLPGHVPPPTHAKAVTATLACLAGVHEALEDCTRGAAEEQRQGVCQGILVAVGVAILGSHMEAGRAQEHLQLRCLHPLVSTHLLLVVGGTWRSVDSLWVVRRGRGPEGGGRGRHQITHNQLLLLLLLLQYSYLPVPVWLPAVCLCSHSALAPPGLPRL